MRLPHKDRIACRSTPGPEIPAHGATDDCGGKAMTVIKRFRFLHRTILRDRVVVGINSERGESGK